MLLSRDQFREGVFARDNHKCVLCGDPAQDAHHIMERRLFDDGGYYLDNGASVCGPCHIRCERTDVSVEEVREAAGITKKVIPQYYYDDVLYDKWGNVLHPDGKRSRGELFDDVSVQKILADKLSLFVSYVKYPRTNHLPWSGNIHDDDRVIRSLDDFAGQRVIVTEKMDGENTTMYNDYIHARSVQSRHHVSRDWVKQFWSNRAHDIPDGWRVCGENLYAEHSIPYNSLKSYFYGFSIWNENNICLSWDDSLEWFALLGIEPVPVLYDGIFDEVAIRKLNGRTWEATEGYVVRVAGELTYRDFKTKVAKYVRKDHVQTVKHWMHGRPVVPNKLG